MAPALVVENVATLLDRERELAELGRALSQAQEGRGRVVLVEAAAGLGKTSLLRAASQAAADAGFTCLRARATELERDFAYGCVRQLLEPAVEKVTGPEREHLFEWAAAQSTPLFAPTGAALASLPVDSSFAVLHGLYWLLNNLADEGPVVLAVDDIHWSDPESLRFLNYLGPRLDGLPVAVLVSTRRGDDEVEDLARLAADPDTTVLRPGPLGVGATAMLCEQRLGAKVADEFAAACRESTGGNPFFLEALLREAKEQRIRSDARGALHVPRIGPATVAQAVLLRLSGAPAAAGAVVRAAAVLGDGASVAEAAGLAGVTDDEAARAADRLTALAILGPGHGLEFAHPIVREAVYADIAPRERAEAHARAVEVLVARGASEERVAAQIVQAEPAGDPERVELLRRTAAEALVRGAPGAAVAWLRRALAEPPPAASRPEVLVELGSAELRLWAPGAIDHLAEAVDVIEEPGLLTTAVRRLATALTWSGESDRAVEALESAIPTVEASDRELALCLTADLAAHAQEASLEARAPAARRLERHRDLIGASPGERLAKASLAFERARASQSESDAAAYMEAALAGGRLLGEQEVDVAPPIYVLVVGLLATDALDVADACLDQMLADARARVSVPAVAFVLAHQGVACMRRGVVARAEADARTALDLLTTHDIPLGATLALGVLIEALVEGGEVDAAGQALTNFGPGDEIPPGLPSNPLLEARSLLRLAQGRTREGLDDLVEFGRRDELWGGANPLASRWRSRAALALDALGERERARHMAAEDVERARRWGAPSGLGVALRATALVDGGPAIVDRLREAVDVLAASPARLEHARALTDLGAALRRANRRADARGVLQTGLDLARNCGARSLAARARTELSAAGGRSSEPTGTGVQQLTASERRVAELAAEGHSNPEIAQALFVTRKTVETHLGHVYRKLDISRRGQLHRALADRRS